MTAENDEAASIGRRIKEARKQRELTQRALADAAGLSDRYISNIECGKRQPTLNNLQAIAGAMRIGLKDLMSDVPATHKPIDADIAKLASLLKDASPNDRARAIDVVRSLVKPRKPRK